MCTFECVFDLTNAVSLSESASADCECTHQNMSTIVRSVRRKKKRPAMARTTTKRPLPTTTGKFGGLIPSSDHLNPSTTAVTGFRTRSELKGAGNLDTG